MNSQMTIGKKLFLTFGAVLALTMAISAVSLQGIGNIGGLLRNVIDVNAKMQFLAAELDVVLSDFTAEERGIIRRAEMRDHAAVEKYNKDFDESAARIKARLSEMAALARSAEGQTLLEQIRSASEKIVLNHGEFMRLIRAGNLKAASEFVTATVMPLIKEANPLAGKLVSIQSERMAQMERDAQDSVSRVRWIVVLMIGLALGAGVVVVFMVRQINRGLREAVSALSEGAEQTASAAREVSSSSQSLAQGASEQAASLEETSASSEQINAMASRNTENSRAAADLVTQSQQKFMQTNKALELTVVAMDEINAQSGKISKIIKVIDEIAFQTNILALNAAVEAARAGEAGMGFAVVADEVRNLAQRCAQAAKDTSALIEESIAKSSDGQAKVNEVAGAIQAITGESGRVRALVDEVNVGSQEQARGIEQVAQAIRQMEQVTQKTAASAEESAAASEELTAQSASLKAIVHRLTAMVGGDDPATRRLGPAEPVMAEAGGRRNAAMNQDFKAF